MKIFLVFSSVLSMGLLCSNASAITIDCPAGPVAVTPSLAIDCWGNSFDFGSNPLPLGGSVTLTSLTLGNTGGFPAWFLNFGFPNPSVSKIELDYSVVAYYPSTTLNGVTKFALGMSADPFYAINSPNESGSNFQISETAGAPTALRISSIENVNAYVANGQTLRSLGVTTIVTDNAGDLTGFDEAFAVPEPRSWALLVSGLVAFWVWRRCRRRGISA